MVNPYEDGNSSHGNSSQGNQGNVSLGNRIMDNPRKRRKVGSATSSITSPRTAAAVITISPDSSPHRHNNQSRGITMTTAEGAPRAASPAEGAPASPAVDG